MRKTHLFLAAGEGLGSKISLFILLVYAGDGHSHWRYGGETPTPYTDPGWAPSSADARTRIPLTPHPRLPVPDITRRPSPAHPDPRPPRPPHPLSLFPSGVPPDSTASLFLLRSPQSFWSCLQTSPLHLPAPGAPPWSQVSPACAGRFQSPVDIRPELTAFCPALRPLELLGFELPPRPKLRLCNTGHTGEAASGGATGQGRGLPGGEGTGPGSEAEGGRAPAHLPLTTQCS